MLLAPFVATFKIETVFATLFATAASPVSWSAATPREPEPVVIGGTVPPPASSTIEALLLPLFATIALCRRGRTATPVGLVPTATGDPMPVERLISATVPHPDKVTAAMFCTGSMATPAGSGSVEQPGDTSMLCITVKSVALVTAFVDRSNTSRANRWAEDSCAGSTVAVNWRLLTKVVESAVPSRRTLELLENPVPIIVSGGLSTPGPAGLVSVDLATNVLGYVSVMESG